MHLATYTYNGKRNFAGEFVDSLATFYRKRWLLRYFVRHQVTRSYKRSYLGLAWAILGPLIWVFFLTIIFSKVLGLRFRVVDSDPTLNFGLFLYCGLLPFMAFSEALNKGLNTIKSNAGLVQKVVFPLELLPFTNAFASLVDKVFGVSALVFVVLVIQHRIHWEVLLLPFVMVLQLLFTLGLTYTMSVLGTYVPDMGEIMRPIIRGTFFITPILWPPARLPENLRWIEDYNPLAYLVDAYRGMILEGTLPGGLATLYFALFSVAIFVAGFALFVWLKPGFADHL
jgi:ABC-2 type transport system permease protein